MGDRLFDPVGERELSSAQLSFGGLSVCGPPCLSKRAHDELTTGFHDDSAKPRQELPALPSGSDAPVLVPSDLRTAGLSANLPLWQLCEAGGAPAAARDSALRQAWRDF